MSESQPWLPPEQMPRWVWKATAIFWAGFIVTVITRSVWRSLSALFILLLVSLFLSLAVEPGVNRLAARGWRRGTATIMILVGVFLAFLSFIVAIGTLVGQQVATLLGDSEKYVNRTVNFINDKFDTHIDATQVIDSINDPNGPVQRFIRSQQGKVVDLSVTALGVFVKALSVLLFTFYLVADGPKLRRAICSRLRPNRQRRVLSGWELAIDKTGGYIYSRALLAGLSAFFHWVLFQAIGIQAPVAMALWVGLISQFLPVIGTYIAGALPVLVQFVDSPPKALVILIFVILYQQVENYFLLPRVTARTMDLHPAVAFGAAIAGAAVLGAVGAILAIPAAAMAQAVVSDLGERHEVIDSHLTSTQPVRHVSRRERRVATGREDGEP
jgi:predicted PurR-regulated permease PerM